MTGFVLAHVSDLHLGPIPPFAIGDWNLKRGLGILNWHRRRKLLHSPAAWALVLDDLLKSRPDHIALTGDLINLGLPAEHLAAAEWLKSLGADRDVSVVPGNHDIYTRLRDDPGIERWRPYMLGDDLKLGPVDGFPYRRRRGPLTIIGLNSAEPTRPFVASGRVGRRQIAAAAEALAAAGQDGACRCVLIHHPPLPGQAKRGRELRDAADLAAMLRQMGVEIVLHGHNHRDMMTTFETGVGPALVCGIASGSMVAGGHEPPARYGLLEVARTDGGWRVETVLRGLAPSGGLVECRREVVELPRGF